MYRECVLCVYRVCVFVVAVWCCCGGSALESARGRGSAHEGARRRPRAAACSARSAAQSRRHWRAARTAAPIQITAAAAATSAAVPPPSPTHARTRDDAREADARRQRVEFGRPRPRLLDRAAAVDPRHLEDHVGLMMMCVYVGGGGRGMVWLELRCTRPRGGRPSCPGSPQRCPALPSASSPLFAPPVPSLPSCPAAQLLPSPPPPRSPASIPSCRRCRARRPR